ncbi:MAG: hypothetical protein AAF639_23815 [Chloroflexota bacterium]
MHKQAKTQTHKPKWRSWVLGILLFAAILIRIVLVYRHTTAIQTLDWSASWYRIPLSMSLMSIGLFLAAKVWSDLMTTLGSELPTSVHIQYYCITHVSRRIPGNLWFLAGRGYLYQQHEESLRVVAVASGVEWFIGLLAGGIMALLMISYSLIEMTNQQTAVLFIALASSLLLLQPQTIQWLAKRAKLTQFQKIRYQDLLKWLIQYMVLWSIGGLILYFITGLVTDVSLPHFPHILGSWSLIGTVSALIIFIPTNLGFSDIGLAFLLTSIMPASVAIVTVALSYFVFLVYEIIGIAVILGGLSLHHAQWLKPNEQA